MKPRVYSIRFPDQPLDRFVCDRTVVRFRALPIGAFFLIGADEDTVYQKVGALLRMTVLPWCGDESPMNDNPWCEPLVEAKAKT